MGILQRVYELGEPEKINTTQYNMIKEFNVDWKAECSQLDLAHETNNEKYKEKELKTNKRSVRLYGKKTR